MADVISKRSIVYDITFNTTTAQKGAKDIGTALKGAEKEIDKATAAVNNFADKTLSAGARLRQIKNELNNFKGNQKQFESLSLEAAKLADQIQKTNQRIAVLASSTRNIQAVTSAFTGLTGIFTAAQGAQALFGKESQDLQRALVRLQGSMALLQGVQSAVATVTEQSAAKTVLLANAQKFYNFVVGSSTGALKGFRIALAATGIGLAVIAIAALVTNWDAFSEAVGLSNKQLEENNKFREESLKKYGDEIGKVTLLKEEYEAANTSQERRVEIIKELKELSPAYFGDLSEEKGLFVNLTTEVDKYIKALELKGIIEAKAQKIAQINSQILEVEASSYARTHRGIEQRNKLIEQRRKLIQDTIKDQQQLQKDGGDPLVKPVEAEDIIPDGTIKALEKKVAEIQEKLQVTDPKSLLFAQLTIQAELLLFELDRIKTQFDDINISIKDLGKTLGRVFDIEDPDLIAPIINTDALEEGTKKLRAATQEAATFGEVVKDNAEQIEQSFATIFGNLGQLARDGSNAQIAFAFANIIAANAEAIAKSIASAASIPWPGNIPAILSSVATVTSLFAQVKGIMSQAQAAQSSANATAFAEGEIDIHRQGETRGKDSIPAVIMPGESVIRTDRTRQYKTELQAIQAGNLEEIIRVNYIEPALVMQALNGSKVDSTEVPDYSDKFYRQYLATGEGNINSKRMIGILASIDRKLGTKPERYSR